MNEKLGRFWLGVIVDMVLCTLVVGGLVGFMAKQGLMTPSLVNVVTTAAPTWVALMAFLTFVRIKQDAKGKTLVRGCGTKWCVFGSYRPQKILFRSGAWTQPFCPFCGTSWPGVA